MKKPSTRKRTTGVVQHKETREDRRSKEYSDLKKENRQLRRQVASLRKELNKPVMADPDDDQGVFKLEESTLKCIKCQSSLLTSMTLPTGSVLRVCKECKSKQPLVKAQ